MAFTYYGTNGLIALPGRTVQAFPSGLVRVDRKYACRTASLDNFLGLFEIEGFLPFEKFTPSRSQPEPARIFPNPTVEKNDNGYSIISASGYYPSNPKSIPKFSVQIYQISKSYTVTEAAEDPEDTITYSWTISEDWFVENSNYSFVAHARDSIIRYIPYSKMVFEFKRRNITGSVAPGGNLEIPIVWQNVQKSLTRRNFGFYDEVDTTSGPEPIF